MNCEEARTQFVDYWRGALEDPLGEFRAHLDSCERCHAEAAQLTDVWSTQDPYEYKVLSQNEGNFANVGVLAFNPLGRDYTEMTSNGATPLR